MSDLHAKARSTTETSVRRRDKNTLSGIDRIIEKYGADKSELVSILYDIQAEYKWLSEDVLKYVAKSLDVSLVDVYGVASFYKAFSLEPRGEHLIRVCLGTACHVRGGPRILERAESILGVKAGETTADLKFSLERVNCLGCCALGPVMVVDDEYYGKLLSTGVKRILHKYGYSGKTSSKDEEA